MKYIASVAAALTLLISPLAASASSYYWYPSTPSYSYDSYGQQYVMQQNNYATQYYCTNGYSYVPCSSGPTTYYNDGYQNYYYYQMPSYQYTNYSYPTYTYSYMPATTYYYTPSYDYSYDNWYPSQEYYY